MLQTSCRLRYQFCKHSKNNLAQSYNESLARTSWRGGEAAGRQKAFGGQPRQHQRDRCHLERCLDTRFDLDSTLVAATIIANLNCWPETLHAAKEFGDAHIVTLTRHYKTILTDAGADIESISSEWTMLKTLCFRRHGNDLASTSWQTINREFVDEARSVLLLIDLLLSIPATSVEAERGFSTMKLVKTDFRSKLSNTALNSLLRIVLLSPTESEFDPTPAVEHWYNAVDRRQGTGRRQNDDDESSDSDDDSAVPLVDLLHDAAGR